MVDFLHLFLVFLLSPAKRQHTYMHVKKKTQKEG